MTSSTSDVNASSNTAPEPTGWTGWISFAGAMMVLLGCFHAIQGLLAIFQDEYYLVGDSGLAIHVDYTAWGVTHLVLGALIAFAGFSLFAGRTWARIVAVIVAVLSALVNVGFLAAYPVWSSIMIAIDVLIIFAVTVHGREMKNT